jgi:tetratricopeptide (TPR) repeat protein
MFQAFVPLYQETLLILMTAAKHIYLLLAWAIPSYCLHAQPASPGRAYIHDVTIDGIESLYNFRFIEAEQKFNKVIEAAPQDPRGYFFKSMIYGYRFAFMKQRVDYDTFMELSEQVIKVSEESLDYDRNSSTVLFYLGGTYGYRGVVHWLDGERLSAFWDPTNHDAEMGLGIFHCMLSNIPSSYRWLVKLAGFDGDRQKGLEQLEQAAINGVYTRTEARQWLSQFYQQDEEYDKAFFNLDRLAKSYPDNPFYVLLRGNALLFRLRRPEDALRDYRKVLSIKNAEADRFINSAYNYIGDAYRFQNRFSNAIQSYLTFTGKADADTALQSRAKYWIGNCYELMGNRQEAIGYYTLAQHVRDAAERLKTPLSQLEISIRTLNNYYSAGSDSIVIDTANTMLNNASFSEEQRSRIHYVLGQAYEARNDLSCAKEQFDLTLSYSPSNGSRLQQNAFFRRGIIHRRMGLPDLARKDFEKALSLQNNSGEHWHRDHIERELEKLK